MNSFSPATSRFVALALLLLIILCPIFYVLAPLVSYYSEKYAEVENLANQLQRFEFLIAREADIDRGLARMETLVSEGDVFLEGNTPSIASANLRELVNEAVRRSGGQLVSSQEYAAEATAVAVPIGLRLQVSGEVQNLVNLLYELESGRPLVFIDTLTVTSSAPRVLPSRVTSRIRQRNTVQNSLHVQLDIVSYMPGEPG